MSDDFDGLADRSSDLVHTMLQEGHDPGRIAQVMIAATGLDAAAYSTAGYQRELKEEDVRYIQELLGGTMRAARTIRELLQAQREKPRWAGTRLIGRARSRCRSPRGGRWRRTAAAAATRGARATPSRSWPASCGVPTARSYWHLLATRKPEPLPGRRGRWKAVESDRAWCWGWQDWGPAPTSEDRVAFPTRCDR